MILIFSIENDISTTSVVKWLKHLNQEVIVINPDDNIHKLHKINQDGIYFMNKRTEKIYNLLDAKSCWWRRTGLGQNNFLQTDRKEELITNHQEHRATLFVSCSSLTLTLS